MLKPVPAAPVPCEIIALTIPVFVSTITLVLLLPRIISLKSIVVRLADRTGATPIPDNEIVEGAVPASLSTERVPETMPSAFGAKFNVIVTVWPTGMLSGKVTPVMLKRSPVKVRLVTWMGAVPEFVSVNVWDMLVSTATFPKMRLVALAVSLEDADEDEKTFSPFGPPPQEKDIQPSAIHTVTNAPAVPHPRRKIACFMANDPREQN